MDKRLLGVSDIHESGVQGGEQLLDLSQVDVPHREAMTLG